MYFSGLGSVLMTVLPRLQWLEGRIDDVSMSTSMRQDAP